MLTVNADEHPLMARMHKSDPKLPTDQQDKRSVVSIEQRDVAQWLNGDTGCIARFLTAPDPSLLDAMPLQSEIL